MLNSASTTRPPGMPRSLVALFASASGLSVANVYYAQPLLDAVAADFAISHAAVGGVVTATQAGCALALLTLVPLGDRIDRRRLVQWQCAALVAALVGVALAASPAALLAGMLAVGLLGTAMAQGLIAFAAAAAAPHERGRVVGAAQGGVVVGLLLARVMAGLLADLVDWRGVYLASALAMLALAAVLWRVLPAPRPASTPPAHRLSYPALVGSMLTLLRTDRVLQARGGLALLMFAAFSIFWSAMALPLRGPPHALSHTAIGAFGLVGALGALAATRAGLWADRGLAQRVSGAALALLLLSWLPLWLMPHSLWWLVLGVVALDLGGQAIHVTNQALILRGHEDAHGRLVGCYMLFYAVGSGLGAAASTATLASWGWSGVCVLGAAVSAAALAFWAATLPRMPRSPSAAATSCRTPAAHCESAAP